MARKAKWAKENGKYVEKKVEGVLMRKTLDGKFEKPVKNKTRKGKRAKSAKVAKASSPEKLLQDVLKAAANPNAVILAGLTVGQMEAVAAYLSYPEIIAKIEKLEIVSGDFKAAKILKENKKIAKLISEKAKK